MAIPLRSQGTPLPPEFPYQGQWILKPRIFLYTSDSITDPTVPQFTIHLNANQEDWSFGFDAGQLAAAIGLTVEAVLAANRERRLILEMVEADTPTGERASAKRYTFRVGDQRGSLTIEIPTHFGSA